MFQRRSRANWLGQLPAIAVVARSQYVALLPAAQDMAAFWPNRVLHSQPLSADCCRHPAGDLLAWPVALQQTRGADRGLAVRLQRLQRPLRSRGAQLRAVFAAGDALLVLSDCVPARSLAAQLARLCLRQQLGGLRSLLCAAVGRGP